jgi:hypothetical protein
VLAFSRRRGGEPVADRAFDEAVDEYGLELIPVPVGDVRD